MQRVWKYSYKVNISIFVDGVRHIVDSKTILDLRINDPFTEQLRNKARRTGQFRDECSIVDKNDIVIAERLEYKREGVTKSYFVFLCGYDDNGLPIVEPTVDDVEEEYRDEVYKVRWEGANNRNEIRIVYMGTEWLVDQILLIAPGDYGSGTIVDNHEMRRLAIEQGTFRPFPL